MKNNNMITIRNKKTGEVKTVPSSQFVEDKPSEGFGGVLSDVKKSLETAPEALGEMVSSIPGGINNVGNYATSHNPLKTGAQLGGGAVEAASALASSPQKLIRYLSEKFPTAGKAMETGQFEGKGINDPTIFEQLMQFEKDKGLEANEKEASVRNLGGLLSGAGVLRKIPSMFGRSGTLASEQGGRGGDPLHAAILGLLTEGAAKGAPKLYQKIKSEYERTPPDNTGGSGGILGFRRNWTQKYKSPLSVEELKTNLEAAGDTNTGLGRVINNPELSKYLETEARKYPESGSEEILGQTGNQIKNIGSSLINEIKGDTPIEHYGDEILSALKKSKHEAFKEKESKYKVVNDLADKHGVLTPRTNFINAAKEEIETAKNDPHLSLFQNKAEIAKLEQIVKDASKNEYSLKDNDFLISKIGEETQSHFEKGNKSEYRLYKKLHDALKQDRNEAIEKSGVPEELKEAHNEANEFYKNEYAPFEDADIAKWLRKGGDTDLLINHFVRKGKFSDRSKLIKKLQEKLPEDKKHILGSAYLSNAVKHGEFNPHELRSLYKGLGEKQREALFTSEQNKQLANFAKLTDMNPEALSLMLNPKTGFRDVQKTSAMDVLMPVLTGVLAGHFGGVLPGLAAGSVPYLASKLKPKYIVKPKVEKMTSPEFRKQFIQKLIEQRIEND